MLQRTVRWQGIDDPARFDVATVKLDRDRLTANGTSRTQDYQLRWALRAGAHWVTRSLDVQITAPAWSRRLALVRDAAGRWVSEGRAEGIPVTVRGGPMTIDGSDWDPGDGGVPGIVDPAHLLGADDCDLGLCPVTNSMPILRSILPGSMPNRETGGTTPGRELNFVMAWVEVPSLRVIRSAQIYQLRRIDVDGTSVVRYLGLHRSFEADLSVDRDGLVIDYPRLARRIDPRG